MKVGHFTVLLRRSLRSIDENLRIVILSLKPSHSLTFSVLLSWICIWIRLKMRHNLLSDDHTALSSLIHFKVLKLIFHSQADSILVELWKHC